MPATFTAVESSNILRIGYDHESQELFVTFRTGNMYKYAGVPHTKHQNFLSAKSKGHYFAKYIRNKFKCEHIGTWDDMPKDAEVSLPSSPDEQP